MVKLIIQIPCFNEEFALPITLQALPRHLPGIDRVEWLIIDDGSTDRTVQVAQAYGVDHIIRLPINRGLAVAFMSGLQACLQLGADIIVNTDADNQYCADDIKTIVQPILNYQADIVIGTRPIAEMSHFSPIKKSLQYLGSWVVRLASGTDVADAPSGFRAMTREAALRLHVFNDYTYTLETIIQAGRSNMMIKSVPVRTNADLRPSRLVKSIFGYIQKSIFTIFRIFAIYKPLLFFSTLSTVFWMPGLFFMLRYLYFVMIGEGKGHVQSVILGALLITIGFLLQVVGILADLIATNRKLLEKLDRQFQQLDYNLKALPRSVDSTSMEK